MECTRLLKEIYEDKDGQRKEEVALLSGPNEFVEFYNRLKHIKEFYKKHPNEVKKLVPFYQQTMETMVMMIMVLLYFSDFSANVT